MDASSNLNLPFIAAAQAQKHVTHNEALRALDAVVQLMVLDKDLSSPPGSPADGARYIVAASPTGAWSGQAGKIAAWQDGAWAFYAPREGWLAWVADEDKLYVWSGSAWTEFGGGSLGDVVDDTTPQLGGDLDANGHAIGFDNGTGLTDDSGNEQLLFGKTASAVNQWRMTNAAAGAGPVLEADGGDSNISPTINPKGTGTVRIGGLASPPQGRLTLTSGTAVMTSDVAAATTLYYTPCVGQLVPIYNGSRFHMYDTGGELSNVTTNSSTGKAGPAAVTTNSNHDLFVWNDSGTIRLTRGPAWSSDTARGTGAGTTELQMLNGILTNKQAISNGPGANLGTYVGTVRSDGSSQLNMKFGTAASGGGAAVLGVWNAYNRVMTRASVVDTVASFVTSSATRQPFNPAGTGSGLNNRVSFVVGLQQDAIFASFGALIIPTNVVGAFGAVGHALDASNTIDIQPFFFANQTTSTTPAGCGAVNNFYAPQIGFHFIQAICYANGTNNCTFFADAPNERLIVAVPM